MTEGKKHHENPRFHRHSGGDTRARRRMPFHLLDGGPVMRDFITDLIAAACLFGALWGFWLIGFGLGY